MTMSETTKPTEPAMNETSQLEITIDETASAAPEPQAEAAASEAVKRSPLPGLAPSPTPPTPAARDRRESRRATSDVGVLRSFAIAIPFYGLVVLVAKMAPPDVRAILFERGWAPY